MGFVIYVAEALAFGWFAFFTALVLDQYRAGRGVIPSADAVGRFFTAHCRAAFTFWIGTLVVGSATLLALQ